MNTPYIIIGTNKIKRFSGLLFLTTLVLLIVRYRLGEVQVIANIISYITLCIFLFLYFFTGKVVPAKWSARAIVVATWVAITTMGLSSGGMHLPLIVVYPVLPVMALVMIGKRASKIASIVTILTLLGFILLELIGYNFNTLSINSVNISIMRSLWLIFVVGMTTVIGVYYVNKIDKLALTLQSLAETDYVTGLPSRKMLDDALRREYNRAMRQNKELSILFINIDNLNQLYETAGQMMGDECIRLIAKTIQENFRRATDYTGKFDVSKFLVIISDSTHEGVTYMADKIRQAVNDLQIYIDNKNNKFITVSIACITIKDLKSTNLETVLLNGKDLISDATAQGGNKIIENEIELS